MSSLFLYQLLTTYSGGGRTKDEKTGKMVQTADQSNASIGQAFLRTMKENLPVAVIAGMDPYIHYLPITN